MTSDYAPIPVEDFLDLNHPTLFPCLTPEQIEYLAQIGTQLSFARGELVFEHGQRETPLYVIVSGALDIIDRAPEGDRYFTQCREGTFAADSNDSRQLMRLPVFLQAGEALLILQRIET